MKLNNKCTIIKFIFFVEDIIIKYDKLYIYIYIYNFKISIFTSYIIF